MKKPLVLWVCQIAAVFTVFAYIGPLLRIINNFSAFTSVQIAGTIAINTGVIAASTILLLRIAARQPSAWRFGRIYFGTMFFLFPVINLLSGNLYLPRESIPDDLLRGAGMFEIFRYVWYAFLYIWLLKSHAAVRYLSRAGTSNAMESTR